MEEKINSHLVYLFNFNSRVTKINLASISHAESLNFPEKGGNCINWVLGHIITERDDIFSNLLDCQNYAVMHLLKNMNRKAVN
jgi:hypothetical protein